MITRHYKVIIVFLLSLFILQGATSMLFKSATWDETTYVGAAQYVIKNHRWNVDGLRFHPPLTYYIHSIPLLFLKIPEDIWHIPSMIERGQRLFSLYPDDLVLNLCRIPILLIAVLLGIYVFKWGRELYGLKAGIFALFLYVFSPNILAYSRLITFDIVPSFFMFIAIYYFWKFLQKTTKLNLIIAGITFGLALLSKLTTVLSIPIYIIILAAFFYLNKKNKQNNASVAKSTKQLLLIFIIAFFILWSGYGFELHPLAKPEQRPYEILEKFLPENNSLRNTIYFMIEKIPIPLPTYLWGLGYFQLVEKLGKPSFFLGMYSMHGWWYFFIVGFLIKTPIPVLLLLIFSLVFFRKIRHKNLFNECFLIIPILFFVLFFSLKPANAFFRHLLPIYPFLFVFISKIVNLKLNRQKLQKAVLFLLSSWLMAGAFYIYPDYLAYFNEFIGGPANGYKYMVDSDLDWGQDLKGLKKYMVRNNIDRIKLSYFGTADPKYYGINYEYLPSAASSLGKPKDFPEAPIKGPIAISATELQGVYFEPYFEHKDYYAWLKEYKPIAKIGYSIFIYDIP